MFQILSPDRSTEVGKISKQWSGLLREAFTDADNFGIRDGNDFLFSKFLYEWIVRIHPLIYRVGAMQGQKGITFCSVA